MRFSALTFILLMSPAWAETPTKAEIVTEECQMLSLTGAMFMAERQRGDRTKEQVLASSLSWDRTQNERVKETLTFLINDVFTYPKQENAIKQMEIIRSYEGYVFSECMIGAGFDPNSLTK